MKQSAGGEQGLTVDQCLYRALHGFSQAGERWAERKARGLDDDQLRAAIAAEFGIEGGRSGGGEVAIGYKGGTNPLLTIGGFASERGDHIERIKGKELLCRTRNLLNIPVPEAGFQASLF